MTVRFAPGRWLLHRHFVREAQVWSPLTRVIADDEQGRLLWLPTGVPAARQVDEHGRGPRGVPFGDWVDAPKRLIESVYRGPSTLKLHLPGMPHSVWWLFNADGVFAAWYVNLEEPAVAWDDGDAAGVDLTDHDLDIWVWPDRSWEWKDDDELAERLGFPEYYWVSDPAAVWAAGRRVIPLIEAGAYPFDGTWCDFRPDPQWMTPQALPSGWDRPRATPGRARSTASG
ncbi:MAG TPA: DUF402 domain-containing protein [Micromonosporaceae bacterium]|nr:DUF402 domain-containing protein [Micromonosporaceae bacterium]